MDQKNSPTKPKRTGNRARMGGAADLPLVSIVVPAFNEQEVLAEFHRRTVAVMGGLDVDYEVVFVNDGSTDATLQEMARLRSEDPNVTIVDLSRNFGKEIALTAGLDHAAGDAVVVIDADLQDPPEIIPDMVEQWRNGFHVVYAQRTAREGETWIKRATAHAFYRVMQLFGPVRLPVDTGDFRLMSRQAVDGLLKLRERHRFMKGLFAWVGYSQTAVPYRRDARHAGATKWNYLKLVNLSIEGLTSFTVVPLRMSMYLGLATAMMAFLYGLWIVFKTFAYGDPVQGFPTIMVTILFLGGVQLIALGVIGEYLGRVFNETKQRPLYLVQRVEPSILGAARAGGAGAREQQRMLAERTSELEAEPAQTRSVSPKRPTGTGAAT